MRFQTGAVKQGRNTDSQVARIGGTRCGSGAVVTPGWCDAIAVVESSWHLRRKSPLQPRHSPAERFIVRRHDRSDHSAYRELPVWLKPAGRRTPGNRGATCCSIAPAPGTPIVIADCVRCRTERSCRGALLVAMEGMLDQRRAVRADYLARRRGPAVHHCRGHLLGRGLTGGRGAKCGKSRLGGVQ